MTLDIGKKILGDMNKTKIRDLMSWRLLILGISLLLILITAVFPYIHDGFLKWSILVYLTLAGEMNLAVWWSSGLLFLAGLVAYQISDWDIDSKYAWIGIALLLSFLSLDEIGSVHERIGNLTIGLATYIIIAMIAGWILIFSIWILWKNKDDKQGLIFLLVGFALLVSAAPNEYLEHRIAWPHYLIGPRVAFEEGLELFGAFACLLGTVRYQPVDKLRTLNSGEITKLRKILLVGFGFHAMVAWITANYIEIEFRGNPATWYFMVVFLLVAHFFLSKVMSARKSNYFAYLIVFFYFTALSAASIFFILPNPSSKLNDLGPIANPSGILACQLFLIFALYFFLKRILTWEILTPFFVLGIALGLGWYADNQFVTYIVAGLFSLITAILFLSNEKAVI